MKYLTFLFILFANMLSAQDTIPFVDSIMVDTTLVDTRKVIIIDGSVIVVDTAALAAKERRRMHLLRRDSVRLVKEIELIEKTAKDQGIDISTLKVPALEKLKEVTENMGSSSQPLGNIEVPKYMGIINHLDILKKQKNIFLREIAKHYDIKFKGVEDLPELIYDYYLKELS